MKVACAPPTIRIKLELGGLKLSCINQSELLHTLFSSARGLPISHGLLHGRLGTIRVLEEGWWPFRFFSF